MNVLEWHNRQYRNTKPLPASPQEQPMNKHAELLKEARRDATHLDTINAELPSKRARMIRALADVVEAYDNERAERIRKREERTAGLEDKLDDYLSERSSNVAELAAACKTCDRVMSRILDGCQGLHGLWMDFRAAHRLTKRAVANHERAKGGA